MSKHPTLLQHFRSFAYQNNISNFDVALEYFTVFGGTGWDVNTSKSVEELIEKKILNNYEDIHKSITRYTHNNPVYHKLLSLVANGFEHELDTFKKAKIGVDKGEEAMDYLEKKSLVKFDFSVEKPLNKSDRKSDRVVFRLPFMRFWFAMISPNYKSIANSDYKEFQQEWDKIKGNFSILLSNLLLIELVKKEFTEKFADDPIKSIGVYYDKHIYIDILAKRESGKMLAGAFKYSTKPAQTNMLETLIKKCEKTELNIEDYILFSKNGFSSNLEQMDDSEITLYSNTQLSSLLNNLSKDDLLLYKNKKY